MNDTPSTVSWNGAASVAWLTHRLPRSSKLMGPGAKSYNLPPAVHFVGPRKVADRRPPLVGFHSTADWPLSGMLAPSMVTSASAVNVPCPGRVT